MNSEPPAYSSPSPTNMAPPTYLAMPASSEPPRLRGRFVIFTAWLLGVGTCALLFGSAAPAIARDLGVTTTRVVERDFQRAPPPVKVPVEASRDPQRDIAESINRLERLGEMLADDGSDGEVEQIRIHVTRQVVSIRLTANAKSPVAVQVPAGSSLIVLQTRSGWAQVMFQDANDEVVTGFVAEKELGLR